MASNGRAKAKGSVTASVDSEGVASAAAKPEDISHEQLKQGMMTFEQMLPEADKLVSPQTPLIPLPESTVQSLHQ